MTTNPAWAEAECSHAVRRGWVAREHGPADRPGRRLLDRVRDAARTRHLSRRTEKAYVAWVRRYVLFHGKRHPSEIGAEEIAGFLTWLAVERRVSASTQNQALGALLFLYRDVLHLAVEGLDGIARAKRPLHVPVVLSRGEVGAVLDRLDGVPRLMALLLYGAGLRLLECARLRVKDVDFAAHQIVVRAGKGDRDRVTLLPAVARGPLARQLDRVHRCHAADLRAGGGWVELPLALERKVSVRRSTSLTRSLGSRTAPVHHGTRDESDLGHPRGPVARKWARRRDVRPPRAL